MQIFHEPLGPAEVFYSTDGALQWIKQGGADFL